MNDTADTVATLVAEHHRNLTVEQRFQVAASLFETARVIVESSLPGQLTSEQRRYATAKRIYGNELPEAALQAHATYLPDTVA